MKEYTQVIVRETESHPFHIAKIEHVGSTSDVRMLCGVWTAFNSTRPSKLKRLIKEQDPNLIREATWDIIKCLHYDEAKICKKCFKLLCSHYDMGGKGKCTLILPSLSEVLSTSAMELEPRTQEAHVDNKDTISLRFEESDSHEQVSLIILHHPSETKQVAWTQNDKEKGLHLWIQDLSTSVPRIRIIWVDVVNDAIECEYTEVGTPFSFIKLI